MLVLSALVERKEKSVGCHRPVIALSSWVATWIGKVKTNLHQIPRGTDHDAGERPGEVALQVRQHQVVVVAATQTSAVRW